ncbi:MAG: metal ABC transporter permease [Candidatus Electryonea clarkiae]|nr:metal ABC transporter permease [Candidatus Electryonea clarkiae]MDP8285667.1 metal ABC transporter permease [Candidatus Electryonea clarkiae]
MSNAQVEIQLIASVTAAACALPGVFLVLRRMAMMSDAISHAILLGIVLAFFATHDLSSIFLVIAAVLTGLLTVALVEALNKTRLLREDASIGLVFPFLFSIGVILISRYAGGVHLDTDAVLLGELAFAPFNRLEILGNDIGPISLYVMLGALLLNIIYIALFYKELKISTFDTGLAASLGISPAIIHYSHMGLVSVTAVTAFDAVGSILVVALMIAPAATAYLLTDRLIVMIFLSAFIAIVSAIGGYWAAHFLDASIAGSMATMTGVSFLLAFFFAPNRGMVAIARRHHRQRFEFAGRMLTVHLLQHEGEPDESYESGIEHLQSGHFQWEPHFASGVVKFGQKHGWYNEDSGILKLTEKGKTLAGKAVTGE